MVTVSIIIPNWNGQDMLEKCLASVFKQDFDDFEVILVDNASKDGSVGMVKKRFPAVKIIQNSENFGFAKGCNIGVAKAKAGTGSFSTMILWWTESGLLRCSRSSSPTKG